MKAIQIEAFGNPAEVLKVVDIPDIGAPAAGEVSEMTVEPPCVRPARFMIVSTPTPSKPFSRNIREAVSTIRCLLTGYMTSTM
jgi:hypothetical protein